MAHLNTAEKIETIVLTLLHHGIDSGRYGSAERVGLSHYRVKADDKVANVHCSSRGWIVQIGNFEAHADDLYGAASDCLSAVAAG